MGATSVHLIKEAKMGGYHAGVQRQLGGGGEKTEGRIDESCLGQRGTPPPDEQQVRTGGVALVRG